ncbi:MAG: class I adenylate-forming enzyme family protein [Porticoccaceae bacterium]
MPNPNLTDVLSIQARRQPSAVAVRLPGKNLGFRQLDALVWRAAALMHGQGVRAGDVIALTFTSELIVLIAMLATARLGATVFSVPGSYPQLQKSEMMARARVRFVASDRHDCHRGGLPLLIIDLAVINDPAVRIDVTVRDDQPNAPWLIIAGSGSTGSPKLIPLSHRVFLERVSLFDKGIPLSSGDCVATLIHIDFQVAKIQYLHALLCGASVSFYSIVRGDVADFCRSNGVSILYTAVIHLEQLIKHVEGTPVVQPGRALDFLRALVTGGSTVSDRLRQRVARHLSERFYVRYGTNETGPISDASPPGVFTVSGSIGKPYAGVAIDVVDTQGVTVPAGVIGLVRIATPGVIREYLDDEQATKRALQGYWFLPGDLGKLTDDGELIYCGRADHMMILNGVNIYPAEIESIICSHPAVRDAAAMPMRSTLHQDIPVCAVELFDDVEASETELTEYTVARLGFRAPKRIVRVEKIPRTEQGKLIRAEMARLMNAELGL